MKYAAIFVLAIASIYVACDFDDHPIDSRPAGKIATDAEEDCIAVQWDCDLTENDADYSVFYKQFRFRIEGDEPVEITEYLTSNSKQVYDSDLESSDRHLAFFAQADGKCGLRSTAIDDDSQWLRLFAGEVEWRYRGDAAHSQYSLLDTDEAWYKIASIGADTSMTYIDFNSVHNRLNRPPSLPSGQYYYTLNRDQEVFVFCTERPYLLPHPLRQNEVLQPHLYQSLQQYFYKFTDPNSPLNQEQADQGQADQGQADQGQVGQRTCGLEEDVEDCVCPSGYSPGFTWVNVDPSTDLETEFPTLEMKRRCLLDCPSGSGGKMIEVTIWAADRSSSETRTHGPYCCRTYLTAVETGTEQYSFTERLIACEGAGTSQDPLSYICRADQCTGSDRTWHENYNGEAGRNICLADQGQDPNNLGRDGAIEKGERYHIRCGGSFGNLATFDAPR